METKVATLLSLGVNLPICINCLSEDFDHFVVMSGRVLCCDRCNYHLRSNEKEDLIYSQGRPNINLPTANDNQEQST